MLFAIHSLTHSLHDSPSDLQSVIQAHPHPHSHSNSHQSTDRAIRHSQRPSITQSLNRPGPNVGRRRADSGSSTLAPTPRHESPRRMQPLRANTLALTTYLPTYPYTGTGMGTGTGTGCSERVGGVGRGGERMIVGWMVWRSSR
jgi:hypothetical protein